MAYDLGDTVALTTSVYDADGVLTAATGVVCTIEQPDGTTLTPAVTTVSAGVYGVDFLPTQAGRHIERWTASSPATARSDTFDVRPAFPGYIISLADAKAHLNKTSDADDEELRSWLEVTTEIVDELAGKATARRTVTERHTVRGVASHVSLTWTPVLSVSSVASLDTATTWDVDLLDVDPATGMVRTLPVGPPFCGLLRVVYTAGYASVPARYTGAARIILRHLWESQRGGRSQRRSGVVNDDMQLVAGYAIPRAAADLIGPRGPLVA